MHFLSNPEIKFPNTFDKINLNYKWYICTNKHQLWSNNVFIADVEWIKNNIMKHISDNSKDDPYLTLENNLININTKNELYNSRRNVHTFKIR